ncbi:hypothetical protein [Streptomyces griseorubiginosus]
MSTVYRPPTSARLPLSGDRLPDASQVLATLARTLHVPVLAIVDSDDPALLALLDADITLTLIPTDDPAPGYRPPSRNATSAPSAPRT